MSEQLLTLIRRYGTGLWSFLCTAGMTRIGALLAHGTLSLGANHQGRAVVALDWCVERPDGEVVTSWLGATRGRRLNRARLRTRSDTQVFLRMCQG